MAVPLQCAVVRPSLCAVYLPNWKIPNSSAAFTGCNDFHSGRSLNTDWIRDRVKHTSRRKHTKNGRASSAASLRAKSADFFAETDDDEFSDTVKEFKLTLQLFKRLTQQVHDVNQCMNQQRIYSFKHHMNNEGIASPALRRSQLAAAMISNREIPATQAPYEPCNDLGPACTYLTRPCSRQERGTRVSLPSRASSSAPTSRSSSPALNVRPPSRRTTKHTSEKTVNLKKAKSDLAKDDAEAKEAWETRDPNFEELFVPEELSLEDLEFKFHDPYPETWVDEVVEDACFRGSKKTDPFMLRLTELEILREETVLWERYREEKIRQTAAETTTNSKTSTLKNARQMASVSQNSRTQSAKVAAPHLHRTKTGANKLRRTASAGKGVSSNHATPASDEGSDSVQTFRNSGYKLGVSFLPGSLYPEARPVEKARANAQNAKSENASRNLRAASPSMRDTKKPSTSAKPPSCEACDAMATVGKKAASPSARAVALSINALRNQYELKSTECYDIVELARTFDPPCKDQLMRAKRTSTARNADAASTKGLTPGKSYFSQRRISLTRLVPDETMTVKGIGARNATRPPTGRCKSAKKGHKRR